MKSIIEVINKKLAAWLFLFFVVTIQVVAQTPPTVTTKTIARNQGNLTLGGLVPHCDQGMFINCMGCTDYEFTQWGYGCATQSACNQASQLSNTSTFALGGLTISSGTSGFYTYNVEERETFGISRTCNPFVNGPFVTSTFTVTVVTWLWTATAFPVNCQGSGGFINLNDWFVGESTGGGTTSFSGSEVSGTSLNISLLSSGNHTITASRSFSNGTKTTTKVITVNPSPTLSGIPSFCSSGSDPNFHNYSNPDGGVFSGTGLVFSGSTLDLSASRIGGKSVTYTYTDGNGCVGSVPSTFTINGQNTVDAGSDQQQCKNTGNLTLTSVTSGVTWSCITAGCSYVSGNIFNTNTAPAGTYTVRASKTVGACSDTDDKTITVLGLATVNAGSTLTSCVSDPSFSLTGQSPTTGVWSSNCGSCLSGSTFSPANAGVGTHTATFSHTNAQGCTDSDSRTITVIGLPNASSISTNNPNRCGSGTLAFTASLSGHTIRWYTAASGGSAFRTSNSYSPSLGVGTHIFYVAPVNGNGCESSSRKAISGEVFAIPVNPASSDQQRCGTGVVTFNASGSGSGAVYRWHENSAGGSAVQTGASFLTPSLSSTRDYYVQATSSDGCPSPSRTKVTATIDGFPDGPTVFDNDRCENGVVTVSVGGTPSGGAYRWYTASSGGSFFNSSNSFSPNLSATTTYHVSIITAAGCQGARSPVTATVFIAPSAPSGTGDTRCGSGSVSISASATNVDHYDWYATNSSNTSLSDQSSYSSSVTANEDFWVEYTDNNGCVSPRSPVLVVVNAIPSDPVAGDNERCGSGSVQISASASGAGATYSWYTNASGGSVLNTGPTYDTPSISTTITYYVSGTSSDGCVSATRTAVIATINAFPSDPVTFDNFSCGPGIVTLTVIGAPGGGAYWWYPNETGGAPFNISNSYDVNLAVTEDYWVSAVSASGCESGRTQVLASIHTVASAPAGTDGDRCGTGVVALSAASGVSGTFDWYATQFSNTSLFTGVGFTTPSIAATTSYWVEITDNNTCVSSRSEVIATINEVPANPTAPPVANCGSGIVALNASGSGGSASYDWFDNAAGGSSLRSRISYNPSVATTRDYYVQATSDQGCVSVGRTQVTVTVNAIPGAPTVFDGENCGVGTVSLTVGGTPAAGDYRWYNSSSGGTSFNSTNAFDAVIGGTNSYWVSAVSAEGCEGIRAEIVATINTVPNAPAGTGDDRCGPGALTLTATAGISGTFNWYDTEFSSVSQFIGASFTTPGITGTNSYWVDITDGNGCVSIRSEVVASVFDIPEQPTVPDVERCGTGTLTIIASGSVSGAVYEWFDSSVGGSPIFTGSNFTTSLSLSRSYFVSAISTQDCASDNRTQVDVTINPLPIEPLVFHGESCGTGVITLNVAGASAGGQYRWYLDENSITAFNVTNSWDASVTETTIYYVSIVSPQGCEGPRKPVTATVNTVPSAPSGTGGQRCGTGSVSLSALSSNSGSFNWYATQASVTSLFTGVNYNTPFISSTTSYWVNFTNANGCTSERTQVIASILNVIGDLSIENVARCGSGLVSITASVSSQGASFEWYENQFGGTPIFTGTIFETTLSPSDIYYVRSISDAGCESLNRTPVTVTINPIPSEPIVSSGNICGSGSVSLQAAGAPVGGSYNWYISDVSTSVIATGSSFITPEINTTTGYYVAIVNGFGCEGPRGLVNAVVNDFPELPQLSEVTRCGTGDLRLEATTTASSVNWYFNASGGSAFAEGLRITIEDLEETTTYYAASISDQGCQSGRVPVVATIEPIISAAIGDNIQLCLNAGVYDLTQDLVDVSPSDGFFVGEGVIGSDLHPSISGTGNKEISFVLTSDIGCFDNGSRIITVVDIKENGEELTLSTDEITSCIFDGSIDLTSLPNVTGGTWTMEDADAINVGIIDPLVAGPGEFVATYSVAINGCIVTKTLAVNVTSSAEGPTIDGATLSCLGDAIELTASGGIAGTLYHWYLNDETVSFTTGEIIEIEPVETSNYRVVAENAFGCLSIESTTIIEVRDLSLDFTANPNEIMVGERTAFTTQVVATEYLWDFGDNLTSTEQNPEHMYFEQGIFDVSLSVNTEQGCNVTLTKADFVTVTQVEPTVTAIDDQFVVDNLNVYPSPFNNRFTLAIESRVRQKATVFIYTLNGVKVLEKPVHLKVDDNNIEFENIEIRLGIYMLRLMDQNNVLHDRRIIKIKN